MTRPEKTPAASAREVAVRALRDVDVKEAYANLALDAHLTGSKLGGRDRGLATEITYGVTRRRGTLDWRIESLANRTMAKIDPWARNILRAGAYQILYMDRIPQSAAVNESVDLAKKYGHIGVAKFVNGVLRNLTRQLSNLPWPDASKNPVGALAIRHSHPEWLVKEWSDRLGVDEAIAFMEANNTIPPLTVRVNLLKGDRESAAAALAAEGVKTLPTKYSPQGLVVEELNSSSNLDALKTMKAGLFTVQDESSMLVGLAVDPQPGWTVLDLAAAPGGKSTHLAELMGNKGRVIAVDIHPHKIELIDQTATRLGATIVDGLSADARHIGDVLVSKADAVLCDVPCSGLGTLSRRPDARWRKLPGDQAELTPIQRAILESAAKALKPGGALIYSTCTLHPAENEEMIAGFLADHPEFHVEALRDKLPASLPDDAFQGGFLKLYPHRHGTDGFFIARLKKAL